MMYKTPPPYPPPVDGGVNKSNVYVGQKVEINLVGTGWDKRIGVINELRPNDSRYDVTVIFSNGGTACFEFKELLIYKP